MSTEKTHQISNIYSTGHQQPTQSKASQTMINKPPLAPVFFISHGAPTLAIEPGKLGTHLKQLGQQLHSASALLVISPHWQTQSLEVMTTASPTTLHDFGGFPPILYTLQYPAPGHPRLADITHQQLHTAGYNVQRNAQRGYDHGAWVPLMHLRPSADRPVFQISMPHTLDTRSAYTLGQALAPLRQHGIVIIGSGSLTHNLYEVRATHAPEIAYAREFQTWTRQAVNTHDIEHLIHYRQHAPHAERAHPTEEHYLPLLIAMGACTPSDTRQTIDSDITHGVLSMESYVFGIKNS